MGFWGMSKKMTGTAGKKKKRPRETKGIRGPGANLERSPKGKKKGRKKGGNRGEGRPGNVSVAPDEKGPMKGGWERERIKEQTLQRRDWLTLPTEEK